MKPSICVAFLESFLPVGPYNHFSKQNLGALVAMPMPDMQNNYSQNVEKSCGNLNFNSTLHLTPIHSLRRNNSIDLQRIQLNKIYRHPHSRSDPDKILTGGTPSLNFQDLISFLSNFEETLLEFKFLSGGLPSFCIRA
jgi:hypothetical protein